MCTQAQRRDATLQCALCASNNKRNYSKHQLIFGVVRNNAELYDTQLYGACRCYLHRSNLNRWSSPAASSMKCSLCAQWLHRHICEPDSRNETINFLQCTKIQRSFHLCMDSVDCVNGSTNWGTPRIHFNFHLFYQTNDDCIQFYH